jgi:glycosyltransferase involved in cell wall biosynthesis
VPNWAPIDELRVLPADNAWRRRVGLRDNQVVLYSGTLGLKHDPSILAELADALRDSHPEAKVVVVSEGKGRDFLEQYKEQTSGGADNLVLLDFQPYEDLPQVMASADVLVAILEPDASKFSVPSKVLTYLCSSRPILGVLPPDNSVAEILSTQEAGVVVDPADRQRVAKEAAALLDDAERRRRMGEAGRAYAERTFSPETAADQFLEVFGALVGRPQPATSASRADAGLAGGMTR